jgi:hypothetical protein
MGRIGHRIDRLHAGLIAAMEHPHGATHFRAD